MEWGKRCVVTCRWARIRIDRRLGRGASVTASHLCWPHQFHTWSGT